MAEELENDSSIGENEKVGDYLRRIRKVRGVELEHLAKAIRLSKSILESIEANRWSDFPTEAYLRSYIISMCEKLLIDKHAVIDKFSLEINSHFAVSQANMMSEQNQDSPASAGSNVSKVAIAIVVVIGIALLLSKQILLNDSHQAEPVQEPPLQLAEPAPADELKAEEAAKDSAIASIAVQQPEIDLNATDTLRLECVHSATDNTCGTSLRGVDSKMNYFSRVTTRAIKHNDTSQITITVPIRTKLFINGTKVEYGKFNTLYIYQGQVVNKVNRELR